MEMITFAMLLWLLLLHRVVLFPYFGINDVALAALLCRRGAGRGKEVLVVLYATFPVVVEDTQGKIYDFPKLHTSPKILLWSAISEVNTNVFTKLML